MGLFDKSATTAKDEPSERTTTPVDVPPISAIPDGTNIEKGIFDSRPQEPAPPPATAEAMANEKGWFSTVLRSEVLKLAALGVQPIHVEGPRPNRDYKVFVYAMTPSEARSKLDG